MTRFVAPPITALSIAFDSTFVHDPRSNVYLAQPGSSKELFYVNDKLVLNPIELKAMDQLSIGDTKLMFVPLCSEKFHW